MRCRDIMKTDLETVSARDSIQTAAIKMRDQNVGFLPVTENGKKIAGAVTDRDVVVRAVAHGMPANTPVDEVMSKEVVACHPDDDLSVAESRMAERQKSRMLVVDEQRKLLGVISLSDIAESEDTEKAEATLRSVAAREARL